MDCFEKLKYLDGPWRNDACIGYAIIAMEKANIDQETMWKILHEFTWAFDDYTVEEAAQHYIDF